MQAAKYKAGDISSSLREANGSRQCAPDDRLRDQAIQTSFIAVECFADARNDVLEGYRPALGGADSCSVRSRSVISTTVSIGAVSSYT